MIELTKHIIYIYREQHFITFRYYFFLISFQGRSHQIFQTCKGINQLFVNSPSRVSDLPCDIKVPLTTDTSCCSISSDGGNVCSVLQYNQRYQVLDVFSICKVEGNCSICQKIMVSGNHRLDLCMIICLLNKTKISCLHLDCPSLWVSVRPSSSSY